MSKTSNIKMQNSKRSNNSKVKVKEQQVERHWDFMKGC